MVDHVSSDESGRKPLWIEFNITDIKQDWMIRWQTESVHMLCSEILLSGPRIEVNGLWNPLIRKEKLSYPG